jgi:hypothetical protein
MKTNISKRINRIIGNKEHFINVDNAEQKLDQQLNVLKQKAKNEAKNDVTPAKLSSIINNAGTDITKKTQKETEDKINVAVQRSQQKEKDFLSHHKKTAAFIKREKAKISLKEAEINKEINKEVSNISKDISIKERNVEISAKALAENLKKRAGVALNGPIQTTKNIEQDLIKANAKILEAKDYIGDTYKRYLVKKKRPDVILIGEIALVGLFIIVVLKLIPKLSSAKGPKYSLQSLLKASKLPIGQLTVAETNDTQTELLATETYKKYFELDPWSDENTGKDIVNFVNLIWPIVDIILRYVVPPLLLGYIIWFCIVYWPYVYAALVGWYKMIIAYGTDLLQGKFGCKWYIKMATGWSCTDVNFSDYFDPWKVRYIDIPVYYERLKYIRKYLWVKRAYYEVPYRKYIIRPSHIYKTKYRFAKMLYTTRAFDVLLKTMLGIDRAIVQMPRDSLLDLLKDKEDVLPALFIKVKQAKAQINNKKYPSINPHGETCMCPPSKGPLSQLRKLKGGITKMVDNVNKIYARYTSKIKSEKTRLSQEETRLSQEKTKLETVDHNAINELEEGFSTILHHRKANSIDIVSIMVILFIFIIGMVLFFKYNTNSLTFKNAQKYYYIGVILLVLFILL